MKRILSRALFALALPLLPSVATATPTRAQVERLISAYEPTGSADDLRRLGPGVDRALVQIASDARVSRLRRGRALRALGLVPSVAGRELLRQVVRAERAATGGPDAMDLVECAVALGSFGRDALSDLAPLLAHPVGDVRIAAARSLARTGAEESRALLEQRLAVEPLDEAQAAIRRALVELSAPR